MDFRKNKSEDETSIWTLSDELDGIPDDRLTGLEKGTGEHEGKLRFPLDPSHIGTVMRSSKKKARHASALQSLVLTDIPKMRRYSGR